MEIFNIHDFAAYRKVVINGQEYKIEGLAVEEMLDGKLTRWFDGITTVEDEIVRTIDYLCSATDIPREVLLRLKRRELDALFLVSIGKDPRGDDAANTAEKKR